MTPGVLWFTGLSGAGKTSIANAFCSHLQGQKPIMLDGDVLRDILDRKGFDEMSRKRHNLQVGRLAALLEAQGHLVIVTLISPFADVRAEIRSFCLNFHEVYINAPLQVCIARDPKGLYGKALSNELKDFTGLSSPYDAPRKAEVEICTDKVSIAEAVGILSTYCRSW
jgi:adenylyl-sulfate kinase